MDSALTAAPTRTNPHLSPAQLRGTPRGLARCAAPTSTLPPPPSRRREPCCRSRCARASRTPSARRQSASRTREVPPPPGRSTPLIRAAERPPTYHSRSGALPCLPCLSCTGADVALVDPPRKGLDAALLAALCDDRRAGGPCASLRTLVYISCGFPALAAELDVLLAAGWRVRDDQVSSAAPLAATPLSARPLYTGTPLDAALGSPPDPHPISSYRHLRPLLIAVGPPPAGERARPLHRRQPHRVGRCV